LTKKLQSFLINNSRSIQELAIETHQYANHEFYTNFSINSSLNESEIMNEVSNSNSQKDEFIEIVNNGEHELDSPRRDIVSEDRGIEGDNEQTDVELPISNPEITFI
jgi:hypothetical protein